MIAAAVNAAGELGNSPTPRGGRPRKHANDTARKRAWKKGATKRVTKLASGDETGDETPSRLLGEGDETGDETPAPRNEIRNEIPPAARMLLGPALRQRLEEAGQGQIDPMADVGPIAGLIEDGCDLEADILPIIARDVPELPRPLKRWDAPWLVREILAAREQGLAGHRVEDPPPASSSDRMKVSEKGAVSVYGMGRFPVTLYKEQWLKLLDMSNEIRAFIAANETRLKAKD
jgi:hypothetical protein